MADNQIADNVAVTVESSGLLDLNNSTDVIGTLNLRSGTNSGAQVTTGAGTLGLGANSLNSLTLAASGTGATGAPRQ